MSRMIPKALGFYSIYIGIRWSVLVTVWWTTKTK